MLEKRHQFKSNQKTANCWITCPISVAYVSTLVSKLTPTLVSNLCVQAHTVVSDLCAFVEPWSVCSMSLALLDPLSGDPHPTWHVLPSEGMALGDIMRIGRI